MKKFFGLTAFGLFFLLTSSSNAGHEFMGEMRKTSTLLKEESCSNGKTKVEHRRVASPRMTMSMVVVMLEPDAASKKSEFYREDNKDFYRLIFYKLFSNSAPGSSHMVKWAQSGDLKELDFPRWLQELRSADPNAANSLTNQPGSDCLVTYPAPSR